MKRRELREGERFGKLTVVRELEPRLLPSGNTKRIVLVVCECGTETTPHLEALVSGHTTSCGCARNRSRRSAPGEVAKTLLWIAYRKRARNGGYAMGMTKQEFLTVTQDDCFYCGAKPSNKYKDLKGDGVYVYSGLDRLDPSKGYTKENVVPCCWTCNWAKGPRSYDEFVSWVRTVSERLIDG